MAKREHRGCVCGWLGDASDRCRCTPPMLDRYRTRVSGPLLDRIDLHVEVPRVGVTTLAEETPGGESSATIRARVISARGRQRARLTRLGVVAVRGVHRERRGAVVAGHGAGRGFEHVSHHGEEVVDVVRGERGRAVDARAGERHGRDLRVVASGGRRTGQHHERIVEAEEVEERARARLRPAVTRGVAIATGDTRRRRDALDVPLHEALVVRLVAAPGVRVLVAAEARAAIAVLPVAVVAPLVAREETVAAEALAAGRAAEIRLPVARSSIAVLARVEAAVAADPARRSADATIRSTGEMPTTLTRGIARALAAEVVEVARFPPLLDPVATDETAARVERDAVVLTPEHAALRVPLAGAGLAADVGAVAALGSLAPAIAADLP